MRGHCIGMLQTGTTHTDQQIKESGLRVEAAWERYMDADPDSTEEAAALEAHGIEQARHEAMVAPAIPASAEEIAEMDRIAEINRRNRRNPADVIREQNERAHRFNDSDHRPRPASTASTDGNHHRRPTVELKLIRAPPASARIRGRTYLLPVATRGHVAICLAGVPDDGWQEPTLRRLRKIAQTQA